MKRTFATMMAAALLLAGCAKALDPMVNGNYTEDNYKDYPTLIRGFVDKAYSLLPTLYNTDELAYLDSATDNSVTSSTTSTMRKYAQGALEMSKDMFGGFWSRDYEGIYYVNKFLKDNIGKNTQYLLDQTQDRLLRQNYQGDAFALRAWFQYDLLLKFGGRSVDGELLGFPYVGIDTDKSTAKLKDYPRMAYDDCVKKILDDCDSAIVYLPLANRNWLAENTTVQGAARWSRFDQVSVTALKALTYLLWASDAFNPQKDMTRWENAAKYALEAINYKLTEDKVHGFAPDKGFRWTDPNSPEIYWCSRYADKTSTMETFLYPNGFRGTAAIGPSQNLVDAFPMANGYPITDSRSGYDPQNPYAGRDPRFYATIFYDGSSVVKSTGEVSYTFDCTKGGQDQPGGIQNTLTGYYLKKFTYSEWNGSDKTIQTMPRAVFFITWRDMCLTFAEAANRAWGPEDSHLGMSAKQALAYIRSRATEDGTPGIGATQDPYLDECAKSAESFESLVRNERRIEFCFEGKRIFDLTRWNTPLSEMNTGVYGISITNNPDGSRKYEKVLLYDRNYNSIFLPIPYNEMVLCKGTLVQNEGWSSWK